MAAQRAMTWPVQIMKFVAGCAATAAAVSVFLHNDGGKFVSELPWDDIGAWTKASAVVLVYVGAFVVSLGVLVWFSNRQSQFGAVFCLVVLPISALAYWVIGDGLLGNEPRFDELRLFCRWMTAGLAFACLVCALALRSEAPSESY